MMDIDDLAFRCFLNARVIWSVRHMFLKHKSDTEELCNWMINHNMSVYRGDGFYAILHKDKKGVLFTTTDPLELKYESISDQIFYNN